MPRDEPETPGPADWETLSELLDVALDVPSTERAQWLEEQVPAEHRAALRPLLAALDDPAPELASVPSIAELAPSLFEAALRPRGSHTLIGAHLGAYRIVDFLAEGGMSEVYRGRRSDGQFELDVAIKVLHRAMQSESAVARFSRERQILVELRHDHLCRLYDGGLTDDHRPYVVLELIDGPPITEYARQADLGLGDRLTLMLQAVEAIEYAHAKDVVHRDLKPSNILVATTGDTTQGDELGRVVVLDFGIARPMAGSDLTRTGVTLGTPGYLAPELLRPDAAGELRPADPRSDVYSLGAVFFQLVSGEAAYPGQDVPELEDEPAALVFPDSLGTGWEAEPGTVVTDLKQLELVLHTSLRPDPSRRYQSAAELGADLRRVRDGIPVLAQPTSRWTRVTRWVRRRGRTATAMVAGCLCVALLAQAVRHRQTVREEQARFSELTSRIEQLHAQARTVRMLPPHDVRPDRERLRLQYDELLEELDGGTAVEEYAIGRGALALRDFSEAGKRLAAAVDAGYDRPAVRLALGRALLEQYRAENRVARREADPRVRKEKLEHLTSTLLEPALQNLKAGEQVGAGPFLHPDLARAWAHLYGGDEEVAERLANEVANSYPEFYEAHLLLGDLHRRALERQLEAGEVEGAQASWEAAATALDRAVSVGRSDPDAWLERCRLWPHRITLANRSEGGGDAIYEAGDPACAQAEQIDPSAPSPVTVRAFAAEKWGEALSLAGEPRGAAYLAQAEAGEKALALAPGDQEAALAAGTGHMLIFADQVVQGGSEASFEPARKFLEQALRTDPANATAMANLSLLWFYRGNYDWRRSGSPQPAYDEALRWAERAEEQRPRLIKAWANHALILQNLAQFERNSGADPSASVEAGLMAAERAVDLDPTLASGLVSLSEGHFFAGEFAYDCRDLERAWTHLEEARRTLGQAIDRHPESTAFRTVGAKHYLIRARVRALRGEDPLAEVRAGQRFLEPAIRKAHPLTPLFEGALFAVAAELVPAESDRWLARAEGKVEEFRRTQPGNPGVNWLLEQIGRARAGGQVPVALCHQAP